MHPLRGCNNSYLLCRSSGQGVFLFPQSKESVVTGMVTVKGFTKNEL